MNNPIVVLEEMLREVDLEAWYARPSGVWVLAAQHAAIAEALRRLRGEPDDPLWCSHALL